MKSIISISFLYLCFVSCAFAQETKSDESSKGTPFNELLKTAPRIKKETADESSQFTLGDECGDESRESQLYDNRKGKITKILSANKVFFEQTIKDGNEENKKFIVELAGIDPVTNRKKIIQFLEKYVLNQDQDVEITGNLRKEADKEFKGLIFVANDDEDINWINTNLLEKGIAKYKPFKSANLVSMVMPCRLQKAEDRAKESKIGIWAK